MVKCPKCNVELEGLNAYSTEQNKQYVWVTDVGLEYDSSEAVEDSCTKIEFECPECGATLFATEGASQPDEIIKFLKGEVDYETAQLLNTAECRWCDKMVGYGREGSMHCEEEKEGTGNARTCKSYGDTRPKQRALTLSALRHVSTSQLAEEIAKFEVGDTTAKLCTKNELEIAKRIIAERKA